MKKWLIIFIFTLGLFVLLASMVLVYLNTKRSGRATQTSNPLTQINIPGITTAKATLSIVPSTAVVNKGSTFSADIRLKADNPLLVAIAGRVNMKYEDRLPLEPRNTQITANPELIKAGWSYPVNKVIVDSQNKNLSIDLLMVNLEPNGYRVNKEISLGTIEFIAQPSSSSVDFQFDTNLTKIKDKNGNALKLNLEEAHYTIN